MVDREPLVVMGVVVGLVVLTLVPFGLAATRVPAPVEQPIADTPGRADPAKTSPTPLPDTPAGPTARPALAVPTADPATMTATGRPSTVTRAARSCPPPVTAARTTALPISVDGRSVTGEGVSVAVIDPSGFDIDDPRIQNQVVETASFWSGERLDIENDGRNRHGTASAATVARVAPAADLYLANFLTAHDFTGAVEWALERDVDVIVAPVSFYAKPNDGSAPVSRAVSRAANDGTSVVVPVGNTADRHWEGTYDGGPWLRFAPNQTRLYLAGDDRPVQLWLWWNRSDAERRHRFQVSLYRDTGGEAVLVANSTDYPVGPVGTNQVLFERIPTNNVLTSELEEGTYFVKIKGPVGPTHRVELVSVTHPLDRAVARGSLTAPATARGPVLAVGAARPDRPAPRPRSGHGPTNDGRVGIDLIAPGTAADGNQALTGTSAAAAYTGGVVALMVEVEPALSPASIEAILEATAVDATGSDLAVGHGRLDPDRALRCVTATGAAG